MPTIDPKTGLPVTTRPPLDPAKKALPGKQSKPMDVTYGKPGASITVQGGSRVVRGKPDLLAPSTGSTRDAPLAGLSPSTDASGKTSFNYKSSPSKPGGGTRQRVVAAGTTGGRQASAAAPQSKYQSALDTLLAQGPQATGRRSGFSRSERQARNESRAVLLNQQKMKLLGQLAGDEVRGQSALNVKAADTAGSLAVQEAEARAAENASATTFGQEQALAGQKFGYESTLEAGRQKHESGIEQAKRATEILTAKRPAPKYQAPTDLTVEGAPYGFTVDPNTGIATPVETEAMRKQKDEAEAFLESF